MRGMLSKINKPTRLFFIITFFVLLFSFQGNIFGVGLSQGWYKDFEEYSNLLIKKTAKCRDAGFYGGPIVSTGGDYMTEMRSDDCSQDAYRPYASQYGLQTRVIGFFAPADINAHATYFLRVGIVLSILSALIFSAFILYVRKLFGSRVAIVTLAGVALSVWIVGYARNMYWLEFAMFLPFVFSFVFYRRFRSGKKAGVFYAVLFLLFLLKLLNGYEHVSTMLVSAFVPIVFHEILLSKELQKKKLAIKGSLVLVSGVAALVLAILINAVGLMPSQNGSFGDSLKLVTARAEERGIDGVRDMQEHVVGGFRNTSPSIAGYLESYYSLDGLVDGNAHPIKYALVSIINYLALPAITLPIVIREPLGSIIQSVGMMIVLSVVVLVLLKRKRLPRHKWLALVWSFGVGLLGSLSWLVLMPAHMYPHAHLNGIIFYLPTLLMSYVIFGVYLDLKFREWVRRRKSAR